MSYRFIYQRIFHASKQNLRLYRPNVVSRTLATQLNPPTRRWAIRRYILLIGLPVTSFVVYRLSTNFETRRKHSIVIGSIGRVIR